MLLTIEIFGLLTMITVIFVLIWGFIILNQIFGQLRYKNYLMEKLIETIYHSSRNGSNEKKDPEFATEFETENNEEKY
ncbi:hypothetical protein HMPREF1982_01244 [Clostridiales bacterium oral taxon 876 str. F0540]|nr:hypothetical protein HMPREF1982_01244 [Clostridiales bacterium oral taxon 876 str. F0540]